MNSSDQLPITFLHAEKCEAAVVDAPGQTFSQENDTLNQASGDSDTN